MNIKTLTALERDKAVSHDRSCVTLESMRFIRYPGGKQRLLKYIVPYLPLREVVKGKYTEPFAGSAAVFFALDPYRAILSDISKELIDLYFGIKYHYLTYGRYSLVFTLLKKATTKFATINLKLKILLTRLQESLSECAPMLSVHSLRLYPILVSILFHHYEI